MDNYAQVVDQMRVFGVEFLDKDLPLQIPTPKRRTCGRKGKWWYWLQLFRPDAGGCFVVGRFGSYKTGESTKVEVDWKPLGEAERARLQQERERAAQAARDEARRQADLAALSAAELWARASRHGHSPYLERKGVQAEACRYLHDGSIVLPLLRYDLPRDQRLRAVQRIYPGPRRDSRTGEDLPQKSFTKGFAKTGCSLRIGDEPTELAIVCEGYATALTLRMATARRWPVYMALDAYNLAYVVPLLRRLYPRVVLLVAADDDWKSVDHQGPNPGRRAARCAARCTPGCEFVYPVFPQGRADKDTDFNDLHKLAGLDAVSRQLDLVIDTILKVKA